MSRTVRIAAVPLLVAVLGFAACSSGAGDTATFASSAAGPGGGGSAAAQDGSALKDMSQADPAAGEAATPAPAVAPAASRAAGYQKTAAGGGRGAGALPAPDVRLVKTAQVAVEVRDLRTAAARVRALAEGAGGMVTTETTSFEPVPATAAGRAATTSTAPPTAVGGAASSAPTKPAAPASQPGESVLVLRVPVAAMDRTVDQVATVADGRELSRNSSSEDVTADLADLGSRVKTQRSSVDRVRALLAKAASLQEIVLLESELTRRESDLEALEARQASLSGRADLSTLTVTLRTPQAVTVPPATKKDNAFVAGLKQGWHAVAVSTGVVLTVLGALLPLLVVLVVIGLPLWRFVLRSRFGRRPATVTPPVPAPAGPPAGPPAASPAPTATDGD